MAELLTKSRFPRPVDPAAVARDWRARGYDCQNFVDAPGRQWNDFMHRTNEIVTVVQGRLKLIVDGAAVIAEEGDEVFIPKGALHSVHNVHRGTTRWLFGYD